MSCMCVCVCACVCVYNLIWSQKRNNILKQVHKTPENGIIYSLCYKRKNTRKISDWANRMNSGIISQFFHLVCCVCLVTNQWDLQLQEVNPYLLLSSLFLPWKCYRNTYQCFRIAVRLSFLVLIFLFLITLSLKHWFITKRNYLVSKFCLIGKETAEKEPQACIDWQISK